MERATYEEARGRCDYLLTAKGRALRPVLTALRNWGDVSEFTRHVYAKPEYIQTLATSTPRRMETICA